MSGSQDNHGTQQIILPWPKINNDLSTSNTTAIFKSCFFLPLLHEPGTSVQSHQTRCSHAGASSTFLPAWPQTPRFNPNSNPTFIHTVDPLFLLFPSFSDSLRLQVFGRFFGQAGLEMPWAALPLGLDQGPHIFHRSPVRPWCCVVHLILQPGKKGSIILYGSHSSLSLISLFTFSLHIFLSLSCWFSPCPGQAPWLPSISPECVCIHEYKKGVTHLNEKMINMFSSWIFYYQ